MDEEKLKYRKTHPKCKWCKWYKYNTWQDCHWITCYGECTLKDKIINCENILRIWCRYYTVKGGNNEISTNKTDES